MATPTGQGSCFFVFRFHFSMAVDAVLFHHLLFSKLPLIFQPLDAPGFLGKKIMANLAVTQNILMLVMGEVYVVFSTGIDQQDFRPPVFISGYGESPNQEEEQPAGKQ